MGAIAQITWGKQIGELQELRERAVTDRSEKLQAEIIMAERNVEATKEAWIFDQGRLMTRRPGDF